MGIVLFRPGAELMHLFMRGRVLLEPEPEEMASFSTGAVPGVIQPLADDPVMRQVFGMNGLYSVPVGFLPLSSG